MTITRIHSRGAAFVCALALLLQGSPLVAGSPGDNGDDNPVDITFTKWLVPAGAGVMAGFVGGDPAVPYIGFVFPPGGTPTGVAAAPNGSRLRRLEAMYEVVDGDRSFAAMIRGAQNAAGLGLLDGVVMAGWRIGAPVHVEFQARTRASGGCVDTPDTVTLCFEGTIHIGRAPTRNN